VITDEVPHIDEVQIAQAMVPSGPRVARTTVVVEFTDMSDNFSGRVTAFGRLGAALENPEARARMEGAMRPLMMLLRSGNLGTSFDSEPGTVPYGRTCPLSGSVARKPAGPNGASETTVSLTLGAAVPTYPDSMCRAAWEPGESGLVELCVSRVRFLCQPTLCRHCELTVSRNAIEL
jgi:hypothetical protein